MLFFNKMFFVLLCLALPLTALGDRPQVSLKSGKTQDLWQVPEMATAPTTYEEAKALQLPKGDPYALKFPSTNPGWYTGPDGGEVYQWKRDHYKWTMQDGAQMTYYSADSWGITKGGVSLVTFAKDCIYCKNNRRICFPDGSCLSGFYFKSLKQRHYTYKNFKLGREHLLVPQNFRPLHENFDRYQFHFSPQDKRFVHAFRDWSGKDAYFSRLKSEWNFENTGIIPAIVFPSLKAFNAYRNTADRKCGGGRGGSDVIYFCQDSKKSRGKSESSDPLLRAVEYHAEPIQVILHETTHNLQQLRCRQLAGEMASPLPIHTVGNWFLEGQAEFAAMRGWPLQRADRYERFFKQFVSKNHAPNLDRDDPYLAGAMFVEYLAEKNGMRKVGAFFDAICGGTAWPTAFASIFGAERDALIPDMMQFYAAQQSQLNAKIVAWRTVYAPTLPELPSGTSQRVSPSVTWPNELAAITEYEQVPDIRDAYGYDTKKFAAIDYAIARGSSGEAIEIFGNKSYRVSTADWQALVFPGKSVQLMMGGYTITNWQNSSARRITFPNGKYKDVFPKR